MMGMKGFQIRGPHERPQIIVERCGSLRALVDAQIFGRLRFGAAERGKPQPRVRGGRPFQELVLLPCAIKSRCPTLAAQKTT